VAPSLCVEVGELTVQDLARKHRPRTFDQVAGQRQVSLVLQAMVRNGTVPPALLFHGTRGSGKTSTARILGAALNCGEYGCGQCESCRAVAAGTSLDVHEIDAASNGLVADVRRLKELVLYGTAGRHRTVILDEAHSMSDAAFNALLKVLEEPPERTVFVLVTTEPGRIPRTIASRCTDFGFRMIPAAVIVQQLTQIAVAEKITVDAAVLAEIAERADGGLRDAVKTLDHAWQAGVRTLAELEELTGESDFGPVLLESMRSPATGRALEQLDQILSQVGDSQLVTIKLVRCLKDLLVLQSGHTLTVQGEALRQRQVLAGQFSAVQVVKTLQVIWETQRLRTAVDAVSLLYLMVTQCAEHLRSAPLAGGEQAGNGHQPLDIGALRELAGSQA
jgi:DNA polymerase III subunit gamma/tau